MSISGRRVLVPDTHLVYERVGYPTWGIHLQINYTAMYIERSKRVLSISVNSYALPTTYFRPFIRLTWLKEWISLMSHNISFMTYNRDSVGGWGKSHFKTFIVHLCSL